MDDDRQRSGHTRARADPTLRHAGRRRPRRPVHSARPGLRLPRSERLGQVDDDPHAVRPAHAERGDIDVLGLRIPGRSRGAEAPHRLHDPEVLAVRRPDGAARTCSSWRRCTTCRARRRDAAHRRTARALRLRRPPQAARRHDERRPEAAAGAGRRDRCTNPNCCSSTNRPARSIRNRGATSGRACSSSPTPAPRFSCRRTTWTKPSAATASRSSNAAVWSPTARRKRCARRCRAHVWLLRTREPRAAAGRAAQARRACSASRRSAPTCACWPNRATATKRRCGALLPDRRQSQHRAIAPNLEDVFVAATAQAAAATGDAA